MYAFFLLLYLSASGFADPVRGELWILPESVQTLESGQDLRDIKTKEEQRREMIAALLEDARWIISGMIYGFLIQWTPLSIARNVEESLDIQPAALISRGDPRMKMVKVVYDNEFDYVLLEYHPDTSQMQRITAWKSQTYSFSSGIGIASLYLGETRRDSMKMAIKNSLGDFLRAREYNKPERIRARVGLLDFPAITLKDHRLFVSLKLAIDIKSVEHYRLD